MISFSMNAFVGDEIEGLLVSSSDHCGGANMNDNSVSRVAAAILHRSSLIGLVPCAHHAAASLGIPHRCTHAQAALGYTPRTVLTMSRHRIGKAPHGS